MINILELRSCFLKQVIKMMALTFISHTASQRYFTLKYIVVRQLGEGMGNLILLLLFFLLYVVIFNTSCVVISALKTDI